MNRVENSREEIAAADHPTLRFFSVDEHFAQRPATNVSSEWKPVSPATVADCSAVAYYFACALQQKLGVPVGLVVSSVGGTRIETWMQPETLAKIEEAKPLLEQWKNVSPEDFEKIAADYRAFQQRRDHGAADAPKPVPPARRCHDCPGALHNGMIAPLQPFAIRGVLWYQGEANSGRPAAYEKLLPALIADWRQVWGKTLPFLFVQLPPYQGTHPAFREAQTRIWQKTPHTAMVVTTDVGDAKDIHPTRKRPVGERLALAARALSYGEQIEYSGPVFDRINVESNRVVVSFKHVGSGLVARGDSLKGFTIAGADGKFVPATALIDGANVVVRSETITNPVAIRYGWAMVPDVNLFNREGLPAVPFRTDSSP
jgi:sialate O-acetylesterase